MKLYPGEAMVGGPWTLSIPNLPDGWRVTFEPAVISPDQSSTMTVWIAERAERKNYLLYVTATAATGQTLQATYSLGVWDSPWSCPWWVNKAVDGGFEAGTTSPWKASSGVITNSPTQPASAGNYKAWLGRSGWANMVTQTITLPPICLHYGVYFDLHIDTAEPSGAPPRDQLTVLVNDTVLKTYTNTDARTGYHHEQLDLSAFADSTIRLTFISTQDSHRRTNFVVDEVFVRGIFR